MAAQQSSEIIGPFTDIVQNVPVLVWETTAANVPGSIHWRTLLITACIAVFLFVLRAGHGSKSADGRERKVGLFAFLLPKDIYTHMSARVDIWLWVLERILYSRRTDSHD